MRPTRLAAVVLLLASQALAGDWYRWTDANGVVHFADVPAPNARGVSTQELPPASRIGAPPVVEPTVDPNAASTTPGATPDVTPGATPAAGEHAASGPPHVVLTKREEAPRGDGNVTISGAVKNDGGEAAEAVAVSVRVVEPTQGDECLTDEIAVEPTTLAPGESGTFSADFNHPCFRGETNTELQVVWD